LKDLDLRSARVPTGMIHRKRHMPFFHIPKVYVVKN